MARKSGISKSRTATYIHGSRAYTYDVEGFRTAAKALRSAGILDSKTNLTKLTPTDIRGGKTIRELIKEFDPVIRGKAVAVPVSAVDDKAYRKTYAKKVLVSGKTGKRTEMMLVPKSVDETVEVKDGKVVITHPAGIERVQLPVEYHNLEQYLRDVKNQKVLKQGKQFAFRFYGGSSDVFSNMELLLDALRHYESISDAIKSNDSKMQREMYRNLEIVRVKSSREWFKQREKNKSKKGRKK
jgi:hypothetical protein